jgi:aryl sulfotransferase
MSNAVIQPTRELVDFLSDSRVWPEFMKTAGFVEGDIVIADPFKAGTTWTQRTVEQILNNGEETGERLSDKSPWLDSSWGDHAGMIAKLKEQADKGNRRVMKSHLPADCVPIQDDVFYIFVGRNGKDLACSFHNYLHNFNSETMQEIDKLYSEHTGKPQKLVIPESAAEFFDLWLDSDGYLCCDLLDVTQTWWNLKDKPNVLMLHYNELKSDLETQVKRLAEFLKLDPASLNIEQILEHCDFGYMKKKADSLVPFNGQHMKSAEAFFHKGPKRDHTAELSAEQIKRFDEIAKQKLTPDCNHWLETGTYLN